MNKPTLRSQKDINKDLVDPYIESRGNPNDRDIDNKARVYQDKVDPIDIQQPKSGFQKIDEAIMYYFKNVIKPQVLQNGEMVEVPVIYGSPERWKSVQREGYYRDKNKKIMPPMIMFKRESFERDKTISHKMDANYPRNYHIVKQTYNRRNFYDSFDVLNNRKPETSYQLVVVPDYVRISFNCIVMTYYMDQLNKIIEAINYAANSYWGEENKYKFKVRINNFQTPTELVNGQERSVRGNFTLEVFGYIIPDNIQKHLNSIKKLGGKTKLKIEEHASFDTLSPITSKIMKKKYYFGTSNIIPTTENEVENLPQQLKTTHSTVELNLLTGTTYTNFIVAIPSSKSIQSVIDTGNLYFNLTSNYVFQSTITINNISYDIYAMTIGVPYLNSTTHRITII